MTTKLTNHVSNKRNEATKVSISESESEGETKRRGVKNPCDLEGGSKGVFRNTNWKNNENLRSGQQTTRHLMRKFVEMHVFKENKFADHGKRKNNACSNLAETGLENNIVRKFKGLDHHDFVCRCNKFIAQLTSMRRQNIQWKMLKQRMSELMQNTNVHQLEQHMANV